MFYINKQHVFNIVFAFALILSVCVKFFPSAVQKETAAPPVSGKVIVIDAGHGSPDGGAVGISGVLEKDLNLSVAKSLGNYLEQSGATVIYTRIDDNSVVDAHSGIKKTKLDDLKKRKHIKNNSGADMFVSIHMNKFPEQQYKGAQVFYPDKPHEQNKMKIFVDKTNNREIKNDEGSIFVLSDSTIPSVVVECGFLSNPEEEDKLQTKEYREKIAFAIFAGITDYINNSKR